MKNILCIYFPFAYTRFVKIDVYNLHPNIMLQIPPPLPISGFHHYFYEIVQKIVNVPLLYATEENIHNLFWYTCTLVSHQEEIVKW